MNYQATKYLEEMGQIIEETDTLYYQNYLVAKALANSSSSERIVELTRALDCTVPDFDIYQINTYRLSWEELSILNCIAETYRKTNNSALVFFQKQSLFLENILFPFRLSQILFR